MNAAEAYDATRPTGGKFWRELHPDEQNHLERMVQHLAPTGVMGNLWASYCLWLRGMEEGVRVDDLTRGEVSSLAAHLVIGVQQ